MKSTFWVRRVAALPVIALFLSMACTPKKSAPVPDHPRLTPLVTMQDATFGSTALGRDIQYRVVLPAVLPSGKRLPVVYLLHGGGGRISGLDELFRRGKVRRDRPDPGDA